jgi:hypothetical protein
MASIASPELKVVDGGGSGDQRVSQFHMMALGILSQVITGALPNPGVNCDALNGGE